MSNGADSKVAENGTHLKHGSSSEREDISGACDGGGGLRGDNLAANGVYGKIAFVPQGSRFQNLYEMFGMKRSVLIALY